LSLTPNEAEKYGLVLNRDGVRRTGLDLLARPDVTMEVLARVWPELAGLNRFVAEQIEIDAGYSVYLERQDADIAAFRKDENIAIPDDMDFLAVAGLSTEMRERLVAAAPRTLGQAARINGVTPAALIALLGEVKRHRGRNAA
ncbi:MAG: tRNA uridine-5-carboxymethylaminomethyl(34) synthesis enzyme MnmG, partial [Bauldia litoralis]